LKVKQISSQSDEMMKKQSEKIYPNVPPDEKVAILRVLPNYLAESSVSFAGNQK